jgi:hypothetical protein
VQCRQDLVDRTGNPLHVRAELAKNGKLAVVVAKCAIDGTACQPVGNFEYRDVGVAFEIADVDHDGTPEVVVSEASPLGAEDVVRVMTLDTTIKKPVLRWPFNSGVAGIVMIDVDGDGLPEVVAASRLSNSTKVDLWRLD